MIWLLYFTETLVLPFEIKMVKSRLLEQVRFLETFKRPYSSTAAAGIPYKFNGFFKENEFRIFKSLQAPQNFIPLVIGRIEPTSGGCILFITYTLFFSTRMFLIFWTLICIGFVLFFSLVHQNIFMAVVAFVLGLINYLIAVAGFKMHLKKTRRELHEIFSIQENPL